MSRRLGRRLSRGAEFLLGSQPRQDADPQIPGALELSAGRGPFWLGSLPVVRTAVVAALLRPDGIRARHIPTAPQTGRCVWQQPGWRASGSRDRALGGSVVLQE